LGAISMRRMNASVFGEFPSIFGKRLMKSNVIYLEMDLESNKKGHLHYFGTRKTQIFTCFLFLLMINVLLFKYIIPHSALKSPFKSPILRFMSTA